MKESNITFLRFELCTKAIAICERIKGGTLRPCIDTIPSSTLKGAFKHFFGITDVCAIGFLKKDTFMKSTFTYAPFDTFLETAKLPITMEYLKPSDNKYSVKADIYVVKNEKTEILIKNSPTKILLGALKTKGFGRCKFKYIEEVFSDSKVGYLKGRLLEEEKERFGITDVFKPCYGYLFFPESEVYGKYKRALFEGSIIKGPEILIKKEEYKYDY